MTDRWPYPTMMTMQRQTGRGQKRVLKSPELAPTQDDAGQNDAGQNAVHTGASGEEPDTTIQACQSGEAPKK